MIDFNPQINSTNSVNKGKLSSNKNNLPLYLLKQDIGTDTVSFSGNNNKRRNAAKVGAIAVATSALLTGCSPKSINTDYIKNNLFPNLPVLTTVADKLNSEYLSKDGSALELTDFEICGGDTAFTLIEQITKIYKIPSEFSSEGGIVSLCYLKNGDFGDTSGWICRVNGKIIEVPFKEYELKSEDYVEWLYTADSGKDLKPLD